MQAETDVEKLYLCPYDPSHDIKYSRMNTHLTKCRKNYPDSINRLCEFNNTHLVPEPELQFHQTYCPDRKKVELKVYEEEGTDIDKFPVLNIDVCAEESWDDLSTPAYDPNKKCEEKCVVRQMKVEPAASRRAFRTEERTRFSELSSENTGYAPPVLPSLQQLPNRATGQVLDENDPESVQNLRKKLNVPQVPFIPKKTK